MKLLKKFFLILIFTSSIWSCSQSDLEQREMDISVELISKSKPIGANSNPFFYPNPFKNGLSLSMGDSVNFIININSITAFKKFEMSGQRFSFNFKDEESGAYNCEIIMNDKVYRTILFKE